MLDNHLPRRRHREVGDRPLRLLQPAFEGGRQPAQSVRQAARDGSAVLMPTVPASDRAARAAGAVTASGAPRQPVRCGRCGQ